MAVPGAAAAGHRRHLLVRPHRRRPGRRGFGPAGAATGRSGRLWRRPNCLRRRQPSVATLAPRARAPGRRDPSLRPALVAAARPPQRLSAGRREDPRWRWLRGSCGIARLLQSLGQSGGPVVAAPLWHPRRHRTDAQRRDLHGAAAGQLLAGPERRPAPRPHLPARRRLSRARPRPRLAGAAGTPTRRHGNWSPRRWHGPAA